MNSICPMNFFRTSDTTDTTIWKPGFTPLHSGAFVAYSGVTLVSFRFIAVSFQRVPLYSGSILVHFVSFRRHSASFRYIPVLFLSISFHSGVIPPRSAIFGYYSCPFRLIPVSFCLVPVYSGTILVHSVLFRRHSGSFRYISVPFLSIPASFCLIPSRSGTFRYIPVYSVPFHSVLVFSNARTQRKFDSGTEINLFL